MTITSNAAAKRSTIRQRAFRERRATNGLIEITVWIPEKSAGEMKCLAALLCDNQNLEVGNPKDKRTGRMVKLK